MKKNFSTVKAKLFILDCTCNTYTQRHRNHPNFCLRRTYEFPPPILAFPKAHVILMLHYHSESWTISFWLSGGTLVYMCLYARLSCCSRLSYSTNSTSRIHSILYLYSISTLFFRRKFVIIVITSDTLIFAILKKNFVFLSNRNCDGNF